MVRAALVPLLEDLTHLVEEVFKDPRFRATERQFLKWRLENPTPSPEGPSFTGLRGEWIDRKSWDSVVLAIANSSARIPSYPAAESQLSLKVGWRNLADWFLLAATQALLEDTARPCPAALRLIDEAVALARGDPVVFSSDMRLKGLRIAGTPIRLRTYRTSILLRPPTNQDLEIEVAGDPSMWGVRSPQAWDIHAIGRLEIQSEAMNCTHEESERLVALLRLYSVTSVRYLTRDDAIIRPVYEHVGFLTAGDRDLVLESTTLKQSDEEPLQRLCDVLWDRIPPGETWKPGIPAQEPTPVITAYRRYCDYLTLDAAVPERRFANVIMGLESLYLPLKQEGELSFRLRLHVARTMGALGFPSEQVSREVGFGYGIRSAHVHGGHLSKKTAATADKKYGGLSPLLRRLANYLRVSIILSMLLDVNKESFLSTIDLGLVSDNGLERMKNLIVPVSGIIPR